MLPSGNLVLLLLLLLLLLQVPWRAPDLPHAPLGGAVQTQRQAHQPGLLRQGAGFVDCVGLCSLLLLLLLLLVLLLRQGVLTRMQGLVCRLFLPCVG
jgi:hypothetical protein